MDVIVVVVVKVVGMAVVIVVVVGVLLVIWCHSPYISMKLANNTIHECILVTSHEATIG